MALHQAVGRVGVWRAIRESEMARDIARIVIASCCLALAAKVQVPLWPVPVTLQPFAVLLIGATLGSGRGALAVIAYLAQGLIGLPVFAVPPFGGWGYFVGPTAGYLYGFVFAAYVVGWLAERGWVDRLSTRLVTFAIGQGVILGCGLLWIAGLVGAGSAFSDGFAPFLGGEVVKLLLAAVAFPWLARWSGGPVRRN